MYISELATEKGAKALSSGHVVVPLKRSDSCTMAREHIRKAMATNFKGVKYILFRNLEQDFNGALLYELLGRTDGNCEAREVCDSIQTGKRIREIKDKAFRLLVLCVWADLPLSTFNTLFDHGVRDEDLPFIESFTHPSITTATLELLQQHQSLLIPYTISTDGAFHIVPAELPLPIVFEELDDRVGHGSYSDVFRVEVDLQDAQLPKAAVLALKRFRPSAEAEIMFHRERILLEHLRDRPHDNIVTLLASFTDRSTSYILLPLAQCSLRVFLNRTTALPLHGDFVLWFLCQLKGLADATHHLHALGDPFIERRWDPDHEFIPSAPVVHGDIKPENILVFPPVTGASMGTFKLSDFGSAQTSSSWQGPLLFENVRLRGTEAYESPDLRISNEPSCTDDVFSLACVFLELLVWLIHPPGPEKTGFMTQRSMDTVSRTSSFWKLTPAGEVTLKPSVARRLLDLEYTGKLPFEHLLQLIWSIILPMHKTYRFPALRASYDLEACIRQAEFDLSRCPNYFLDPTARSTVSASPLPSWFLRNA